MTDALSWLLQRTASAPDQLRERMHSAISQSSGASIHEQLAAAAMHCLERALERPTHRASALDLLTADALLTHACAAAAEAGPAELERFTTELAARGFEHLLERHG